MMLSGPKRKSAWNEVANRSRAESRDEEERVFMVCPFSAPAALLEGLDDFVKGESVIRGSRQEVLAELFQQSSTLDLVAFDLLQADKGPRTHLGFPRDR